MIALSRFFLLAHRDHFKDALEYCKDVDNEIILSEGTKQDYCIDNFMNGHFSEAVPWMLLFLLGASFTIILCFYLIITWKKYRYSN